MEAPTPIALQLRCPLTDDALAVVVARVLAAEDAALERRPWRHSEPELARHRHELPLDRALKERVFDLSERRGFSAAINEHPHPAALADTLCMRVFVRGIWRAPVATDCRRTNTVC